MDIAERFEILYDNAAPDSYGSDCDCACAASFNAPYRTPLAADTSLSSAPHLHELALTDSHTVAFVPSASRVVVVNAAARQLLQHFRVPATLHSLPDAAACTAARQLYAQGLLSDGSHPAPPPPADELIAWLHVTNACNLRCTYCYIDKTDEAMSSATAFAAIDAIFRSARLHGYAGVALKYAGGEASLNLPLVETLHQYAQEHAQAAGIRLRGVVLSNGVGLTRQKLRCIQQHGLSLMISMDGPQQIHDQQRPRRGGQGSFAAVQASVARAHHLGLALTVSITVTGASVGSLPELVAWLLERDIHFTLNLYRECDASSSIEQLRLEEHQVIAGLRAAYRVVAQHVPRYNLLGCLLDRTNLAVPHTHTCAAGTSYLVIDHAGQVASCQMEIDQPVTNVWQPDPLHHIRLSSTGVQNVPVDDKAGCRACPWKYWCAGGCAVATFRATGRYDVQSPHCNIYTTLYPEVIRLEGLRLLRWHRPV